MVFFIPVTVRGSWLAGGVCSGFCLTGPVVPNSGRRRSRDDVVVAAPVVRPQRGRLGLGGAGPLRCGPALDVALRAARDGQRARRHVAAYDGAGAGRRRRRRSRPGRRRCCWSRSGRAGRRSCGAWRRRRSWRRSCRRRCWCPRRSRRRRRRTGAAPWRRRRSRRSWSRRRRRSCRRRRAGCRGAGRRRGRRWRPSPITASSPWVRTTRAPGADLAVLERGVGADRRRPRRRRSRRAAGCRAGS